MPMPSPPLDRFDLYTLCVQNPGMLARFLSAVHGDSPRILREDFSGAAGICSAWVDLSPRHRALAVDKDATALRHASRHDRLKLIRRDVLAAPDKADVIAAINFP